MERILLSYGGGGRQMRSLINNLMLKEFRNPILRELSDSARLNYKEQLAFTTDSFVVNPLWFPGGDIGKLAVCGTVNDLVMLGAVPEYLSLALIIEEGLDYRVLKKIVASIARSARQAEVKVVTGDTKVVEKGAADKIFINTSGLGRILKNRRLSVKNIRPGDKIIVTGPLAQHGLAVLSRRKELDLRLGIKSDCASLNGLLIPLLRKTDGIKFMRDPTRGGVAAVLNEVAQASGLGIIIEEGKIPLLARARSACELLGLDPLTIANEGAAIIAASPAGASEALNFLRRHPLGRRAQVIGTVAGGRNGRVVLETRLGTQRLVEMPAGEALPRIC
ncbi:MAG: hydrogenase expression/formation protein HypE [Omnitrophica WOR_2 bacterium RIFCSPLOWO2_12_FULL_51_8]|nr:MAG: hydrogenase expression/formation protein HypE [Omnitrophica WOR_2 bacterium RIFCSPLOWO2_12_FULL_51_8]